MILTDVGLLIALIDKGQGVAHQQCVEAQQTSLTLDTDFYVYRIADKASFDV